MPQSFICLYSPNLITKRSVTFCDMHARNLSNRNRNLYIFSKIEFYYTEPYVHIEPVQLFIKGKNGGQTLQSKLK